MVVQSKNKKLGFIPELVGDITEAEFVEKFVIDGMTVSTTLICYNISCSKFRIFCCYVPLKK